MKANGYLRAGVLMAVWFWAGTGAFPVAAQTPGPGTGLPVRPRATELLPSNTVAIVTCPDTRILQQHFKESGFYRMSQDPQLRPLITALYGNIVNSVAEVQEQLGIDFEKLIDLAAGELTFAVVAPPQETPQFVVLADTDPLSPDLFRLLELMEQAIEDGGGTIERLESQGAELTVCRNVPGPWEELVYLQHDGTLMLATRQDVFDQLLLQWAGVTSEATEGGVLKDVQPFVVAMNNTQIDGEQGAQVRWWVDPINLVYSAARERLDAQLLLSVLPVLHVNDLKGIGGTISFGDPIFDQVNETHIFVSPPREGIWEAIATRRGDCTPEKWVSAGAASYFTININMGQAVRAATTMFDTFYGEGALREEMGNGRLAQRLGIDLRAGLWDQLDGHVSLMTQFDERPSLAAQHRVLGLHVRDKENFKVPFEAVTTKLADQLERQSFSGVDYFRVKVNESERARQRENERDVPSVLRPDPPQPCFGVVGEYLLIADQPQILHDAILVYQGEKPALKDDPEFQEVRDQLAAEVGSDQSLSLSFTRPEPPLRNIYQVLQSRELQDVLSRRAQSSSFWSGVKQSLEKHPLPAFDVLKQYLAPAGGVWSDQESGWHYIGIGMRRDGSL